MLYYKMFHPSKLAEKGATVKSTSKSVLAVTALPELGPEVKNCLTVYLL
jgi:hypothetical protein